jgi:hypothetical protein
MAATAIHRLTLDPLGKCCAKVRRMLVSKSIIGDVGFKMKLSAAIFLRIVANTTITLMDNGELPAVATLL